MSASVITCLDCDSLNWANTKECKTCRSHNLSMSLHELHAFMYATEPDFHKLVDEQREQDCHCSNCNAIVDKEDWLKQHGYSKEGHYDCPSCGQRLITIELILGGTKVTKK